MSTEKEIPFVIFLKTIYEVRPKKNPAPKQTHHWKLRIDSLKTEKDIKRVEFVLHNTFVDPIQIRKKPPFEIEEDGFGNFQMRMSVKILNRLIPLTYFIELFPQKHISVQYHHSLWMVKPKELEKVLEIGGIPMESYDNSNEESKALSKIWEYVKRHGDRPLDPALFYPKVYDRVIQKIKRLEHSDNIPVNISNNVDMDVGHSDDSSNTRQIHNSKKHRHNKQNIYDSNVRIKSQPQDFEPKKELKRKRNIYESSSESDADPSHENLFGKSIKRVDNAPSLSKMNEVKMEKPLKAKAEFKSEITTLKLPVKPMIKIENKLQKPPKETKLKLKMKDTNPDSFSKLFEAPDLIVLNKGKANLAHSIINHDNPKRKIEKKEPTLPEPVVDEIKFPKKSSKPEKDSKHKSMKFSNNNINVKPTISEPKKVKPPEKTMPPDQKKEKPKSDHKAKKSSSFHSKPISSLSSSNSELGSLSAKSSSDNELDPDIFRRKTAKKKSPIGVKQLFGDDDNDDDDDVSDDEITDLFSVLKNSGATKPTASAAATATVSAPLSKTRKEPSSTKSDKSELENDEEDDVVHSSDNEAAAVPSQIAQQNIISPQDKYEPPVVKTTESAQISTLMVISLKERRKLAKLLLKIKNKKFFAKFQRLLLTSFENRERSVSFDPVTLRLDFHMGEVSDELVRTIRTMVEDYMKSHSRLFPTVTNGR